MNINKRQEKRNDIITIQDPSITMRFEMSYIDFNAKEKIMIWPGITGPVYHSSQATLGHFTLEEGTIVPEHSHPHEQWTNVIAGRMEFDIDGDKQLLIAGMTAYIPSNVLHSARAVTECKVIDCFLPVREDFVELERKQNGKMEV